MLERRRRVVEVCCADAFGTRIVAPDGRPRHGLRRRSHLHRGRRTPFFAARQALGYTYPNYDLALLAAAVCPANGWQQLDQARFYTGIPDASDDPFWSSFWAGKFRNLSRQGVEVFSRSLRYRNKTVKLPNGTTHAFLTAEEKGIDVRIAIDVIRLRIAMHTFRRRSRRSRRMAAAAIMPAAAARWCWTSCAPDAINLHGELMSYVLAGMSTFDALKAATVNPAKALNLDASTIEAGKLAHLVMVDGDSLADLANGRL